jgi:hypothetical protein
LQTHIDLHFLGRIASRFLAPQSRDLASRDHS